MKPRRGYTLIELVVVVALLSIMLGFTLPRLYSVLTVEPSHQVIQWFSLNIPTLQTRAVDSGRTHLLTVDDATGIFRIEVEGIVNETVASPRGEEVFRLPTPYYFGTLEFPLIAYPVHVPKGIRFFREGYSDYARLRINSRGREPDLVITIEPFLNRVQVDERP